MPNCRKPEIPFRIDGDAPTRHTARMSLVAAIAIALACVVVAQPRLLGRPWPEAIKSFGAGLSVAYVVLHLLPQIGLAAATIGITVDGFDLNSATLVYLLVLVGILATLALRVIEQGSHGFAPRPRIAMARPLVSAMILGYLLSNKNDVEVQPIIVFAIAIGTHVAFSAHGLATELRLPSIGVAFAAAIGGGFLLGLVPALAEPLPTDLITALLAGGVMTTTIHEALSSKRRLSPLFLGAIVEGTLLVILLG